MNSVQKALLSLRSLQARHAPIREVADARTRLRNARLAAAARSARVMAIHRGEESNV